MAGAPHAVCICADKNMLIPALFVADGVRKAALPGEQIFDILIFTPRGDAGDDLRQWAAARGITFRDDLDLSQVQDIKILQRRLSIAAVMRLLVPLHLADQYRRVLHLDADLMIHNDVAPLFNLDMADNPLAAVPAGRVPAAEGRDKWNWWQSHFEELGMTYPYRYFNAGVMLIDTKSWVNRDLTGRTLDFIARNGPLCYYLEEDALNAVLDGEIVELSPIWNLRPQDPILKTLIEPVIVHYAGRLKPWRRFGKSKRIFENADAYRIYKEFVQKTPRPKWLSTQWTARDFIASLRAEAKFQRSTLSNRREAMNQSFLDSLFREYLTKARFADVEQGITVRENGTLRLG